MTKKISKKEIELGTKIEMEHTPKKRIAKIIAMDHLREFPNYYSRGLIPMEKKLKKLQKRNKGGMKIK